MRRSMHSVIVALLCLTLFVDSAKACWWLRQHRSRGQVCRPLACRTAAPPPCCVVTDDYAADDSSHGETVFADGHAACACGDVAAEHAALDHDHAEAREHDVLEQGIAHESLGQHVEEHGVVESHVTAQTPAEQTFVEQSAASAPRRSEDSVVVHGPTIVVDDAPKQFAGGAEPKSVVAQPMPVAAASPSVLPTPAAAEEPIPDLRPAIAPQSPVAPASNEQPSPELQATPEQSTQPDAAATPMPAPVADLAGTPEQKAMPPKQPEPNLFDLYGDVGDEEFAPSPKAPVERPAAELADQATEATATDEPAATTPAEPAEESAPSTADVSVEAKGEGDAAEGADQAPQNEPTEESPEEPAQPEADPAEAAFASPDEPMRRWSNDTGTHHAQGWLVEVRADRVRILKVNGRHTTVSRDSLSAADQDYVSAVGERLASERQGTSPASTTTAGL